MVDERRTKPLSAGADHSDAPVIAASLPGGQGVVYTTDDGGHDQRYLRLAGRRGHAVR
jgi:hypothetical protein